MTLHEAIEQILREKKTSMKPSEIAEAINASKLYVKWDNTKVSPNQISARVNKHQDIFKIDEHGISLFDLSIKPYRDVASHITNMLLRTTPALDANRIHELTACLLFLVYYQLHDTKWYIRTNYFKEALIKYFKKQEGEYEQLNKVFTPIIDFVFASLSELDAQRVLDIIESVRFEKFPKPPQEEFSSFFNEFVNAFNWRNNFRGGEMSTPKLVSLLMGSIFPLNEGTSIADPFAGRASLVTEIIRTQKSKLKKIFASDILQSSVTLGSLNIFASGFSNFTYENGDAFSHTKPIASFDLIVTNPPFGSRREDLIHSHHDWQSVPSADSSLNAIQLTLYLLNNTGKAVVIVPESLLFGTKKDAVFLRKMIVNKDILKGVVLLPKNIFKPHSSVSSALLILDKVQYKQNEEVFLYDSSNVAISEFKNEIANIVSDFHNIHSTKNKSRWVSKDEIERHSYDLSIRKYLLPIFDRNEYVPLRELLRDFFTGNYVSTDNINKEEGVAYIQVGDLLESEGLASINEAHIKSFVSDIEIVGSTLREIPKGAILISKIGTKLKPTLYDGGYNVIASSNIIVLIPGDYVLREYLISQLQNDYVQKQIDVIRRYNAIPNFNIRELLDIQIQRRSLEEQREYVTNYYSRKVADIQKSEIKSKEDELYNIISRIKHEVKQPISSIGIDINILIDYLKSKSENKETISWDDFALEPLPGQEQSDIENTRIKNILHRVQVCIKDAQEILHQAEETLNIGKGSLKMEAIEIKHFLEHTVKPLYSNSNCVIKISGKEQTIRGDKYQLKILFKHIIENAIKHGFDVDRPKAENIIKVEVNKDAQKSFAEVIVMNNGKPFPKGFNKWNFETQGETENRDNGSGFGGYHIKRIIENHKGEFLIADLDEIQFSEYKVKFKIYLPLSL